MSKSHEVYQFENACKAKVQREAAARIEMEERGAELHDGPLPKDAVFVPAQPVTMDDIRELAERQATQRAQLGILPTKREDVDDYVVGTYLKHLPAWLVRFVKEENLVDADLDTIRERVAGWEERNRANRWRQGRAIATMVEIHSLNSGNANDIYDLEWGGLKRTYAVRLATLGRVFPQSCERHDLTIDWYHTVYQIAKCYTDIQKPTSPHQWNAVADECQSLFKSRSEYSTAQLKVELEHLKAGEPKEPQLTTLIDEASGQTLGHERLLFIDFDGSVRLLNPDGTIGKSVAWTRLMQELGMRGMPLRVTFQPATDVELKQGPEDQFDV